jgi:CMP-N-acetylneuraminic acid synthetase
MLVTQHLKPIFEENSCFYIFTKESFLSTNSRIGSSPLMYEIDKIESIDIDEKDDFIIGFDEVIFTDDRTASSVIYSAVATVAV